MRTNRLIASAVALALSGPTTVALAQQQQDMQQQRTQQQQPMQQQQQSPGGQSQAAMQQFQQADKNRDGYISVQEAQQAALPKMDQQKFQQADSDNDGRLTQQEFRTAMQGSGQQPPSQAQQQGGSGKREIVVQQEPAQIDVQQKPPEVIVEQHQPDVTIKQPKPDVQISQPEPNVQIDQAEADVTVQQQGKPQVQVERTDRAEVDMVRPEDQQQQQAGRQMETTGTEGLWSMQVGDLTGKEVINAQGKTIGEIENVARGSDDQVYAIVAVGGLWGIGERNVPIALSDLNLQGEQLALASDKSEEQIKQQAGSQRMENYQALDENQSLAEYAGGTAGAGEMTASFRQLDADQDGYVTPQEASDSQTLTNQWGQADRNDDGRIDRSEFSAFETKVRQ